jgi:hypothetical protein
MFSSCRPIAAIGVRSSCARVLHEAALGGEGIAQAAAAGV